MPAPAAMARMSRIDLSPSDAGRAAPAKRRETDAAPVMAAATSAPMARYASGALVGATRGAAIVPISPVLEEARELRDGGAIAAVQATKPPDPTMRSDG